MGDILEFWLPTVDSQVPQPGTSLLQDTERPPATKRELYERHPTSEERNEIRVLLVHPADDDDDDGPLICELQVVSLDDEPEYASLSYTWGEHVFDQIIFVDGFEFKITAHLLAALKMFRLARGPIFWVDQICIDQDNLSERSHQVSLMKRIYAQPQEVLVWIGGEVNGSSEDTERTFYFLDNLLHLNAPWQILNPSDHPKQWEGVFDILSRPWYSRAWIIQEIASCKTVRIFCGQGETNIHSIKALLNLLGKRWVDSMTFLGEQTDVMKWNMDNMKKLFVVRDIHQRGENGRLSLVRTLDQMRDFQATDGRDKIYALLWLFKVTTPSLKPNYRKTVEEVYIEYARQMFIKGHGLVTMIVAGRHQTQLLKLPSWCPDWSQRLTLRSFTLANAERIGMAKHDPDNSIKIEDLQAYGYETMIRTFAASGNPLKRRGSVKILRKSSSKDY